jgi:hypothetical protein
MFNTGGVKIHQEPGGGTGDCADFRQLLHHTPDADQADQYK